MELTHQLVFMGDDHNGDAHFTHPLQQFHHFQTQLRVDVAGGLVRNDQLGAVGKCTGHSHALLFAAGKGVRISLGLILQMHQFQHVLHTVTDLLALDIGDVHGKSDVLVHSHGGDQTEILKDNAHLTAQIRHLMAAQPGNILAQHSHLAFAGQLLAQQQLEQGGFACAGMAQQEHELTVVHMEVDIVQCQRSAPFIFLGNVF